MLGVSAAAMVAALQVGCATNVALPLHQFSDGLRPCMAPPSRTEAASRAAVSAAETMAQRQATFEQGLVRYRAISLATRASNAGISVLADHPVMKATPGLSFMTALASDYAKDYLEGQANDQLEGYLRRSIDAYLLENPNLGSLDDANNLNAFARYLSTKVDTAQFGAVSQEIDAFLVRQVAENRQQLEATRQETISRLDGMQADLAAMERFQADAVAAQSQAISALKADFRSSLDSALVEIQTDINAALRAQEVLADGHRALVGDLGTVRRRVEAQQEQIESNSERITDLEFSVRDLSAGQAQIAADVTALTAAQRDTAELVRQNERRVDVVAAVLWDQSDPETRLRLLNSGALDVSEPEAAELRKALQEDIVEARSVQERAALAARLSQAGEAIAYGQRAVALAARNGLSAEDARRANKIMSYAQVAVGIGRLYAGDPNGLGNVLGGLEGLSGGPGESAEAAAIREGFRQINVRLDVLMEQNDQLIRDVHDLRAWSMEAHLETQRQLARLERLSDVQQQSLDYIQLLVAQSDPPTCRQMAGPSRYALADAVRESQSFDALQERWQGNPSAGSVVRCLVEVASSSDPTSFGFVHETARDVLLQAYPLIRQRRRAMLLLPTFDGACPSAPLLSDAKVLVVAQAALDFDVLVYGYQHQDQSLANFPEFSLGRHRDGHRTVQLMYNQAAGLLDCAMAQQAVLHGGYQGDPILNLVQAATVGAGQLPIQQRLVAGELLKADLPVFKRNLVVRILATEFGADHEAFEHLAKAQEVCGRAPSSGEIDALNRRVRTQRFQFVESRFHLDERCAVQMQMRIPEADNGQTQTVTLTIPDAAAIRSGDLVMPPTFDAMVQLRIAVETRRNEYAVSRDLLAAQGFGTATLNQEVQQ